MGISAQSGGGGASVSLSNLRDVNMNLPLLPVPKIRLTENGTIADLAMSFISDPDTGIYLDPPQVLSMVTGGVECLRANHVANSLNCLSVTPSILGVGPTISSFGVDTDIDLNISTKGTGKINLLKDTVLTGQLTANRLQADNLRLDGNVFSSIIGAILIAPDSSGSIILISDQILSQGVSGAATGAGSELVEFRDDRTTTGAAPNYVLAINQQNGTASVLSLGNDGNGDAILVTGNNDLRIGNDVAGVFTEHVRITSDGKTGFNTANPDAIAEFNGDSAGTVGGFVSGTIHIRSPGTAQFSSAAISGHNTFAGNTQLWFLGSRSTEDDNVQLINRQNADLILGTNDTELITITGSGVAIGGSAPDPSAILELISTDKGFLPPRMTSTQIDEITPVTGLMIYDTDIDKLKLATPTAFKNLLTEDIGHIVVQDSFASSNVRYFGELGLPGSQTGWIETGTGIISLFSDTVFGVTKDVVKHFSTTGNSTNSQSPVSGAKWDNILAFGASFSGINRITEDISTNSIFAGVGFSPANDPRASSIESRVGVFISVNATHTTIRLDALAAIDSN